jgi:hypothetical protein
MGPSSVSTTTEAMESKLSLALTNFDAETLTDESSALGNKDTETNGPSKAHQPSYAHDWKAVRELATRLWNTRKAENDAICSEYGGYQPLCPATRSLDLKPWP